MVCSGRKRPQLSNGPAGRDAQGATLVGGGHEAEEQLGADVVEARSALVDDDEVVAQEALDDAAHGVVGEAPIEGLDQIGRGQVAHPRAGLHRDQAEGHEQV